MKKGWALWAFREAMKSATPVHLMFDFHPHWPGTMLRQQIWE
jgi:hypothetical protein